MRKKFEVLAIGLVLAVLAAPVAAVAQKTTYATVDLIAEQSSLPAGGVNRRSCTSRRTGV